MIHIHQWLMLVATLFTLTATAQIPTIQDCLGAIPICEPIYREDQVANGMGNYPDEITNAISCLADERNAIWYTFTVNQTGDFGFVLMPNSPTDDYDWALYDLTNASCEDIRTDPSLLVSCNAAGQQGNDVTCIGPTGPTGGSIYNIQGAGCGTPVPTYRNGQTPENALVPVQQGNTYVLVVSNWSRSTNGYTIDFSASGGIGIFDQEDPEIADAVLPTECGDNTISITFNENIQCSTIDKFNFVLDGPGAPYDVQLLSPVCDLGGRYTKTFDLIVTPPITNSGSFTLRLDGDRFTEVLDLCDNPAVNIGLDFDVAIDASLDVELGNDIQTCPGSTVELDATIASPTATYLWSTGSTAPLISVTEEGAYSVTITDGCQTGTDIISVLFVDGDNLFLNLGEDRTVCDEVAIELDASNFNATYTWSNGSTAPILNVTTSGTYSVTVANECGSVTDEVTLTFGASPNLDLGGNRSICTGETVVLDATFPNGTYLWQDGSTQPTLEVAVPGTYTVEVSNECGTVTESVVVEVTDQITVDLGMDQNICDEESFTLNASTASGTYLWQDGSTNDTFIAMESGTYAVTVTSNCGTATDEIELVFNNSPTVDLGTDQLLCSGNTLTLEAMNPNATYLWQDGSTNSTLEVSIAGTYAVTVTNDCGTATDDITVDFEESPILDLGADQLLCAGETFILDATSPNSTYLWQDGSTNPTLEVNTAGTYAVTVTKDCGTVSDEITIGFEAAPTIELGTNQVLCEGGTLVLDVTVPDATYLWQDGSTNPVLEVNAAGTYAVTVTNNCGTTTDEVIIDFEDTPTIDLGMDQVLCEGETIILDATILDATYEWQDGSTTAQLEVNRSGTYSVEVTTNCGVVTDQIQIDFLPDFELDLGADQAICEGEMLMLEAGVADVTYTWNTGSNQRFIEVDRSGTYILEASNDCFSQRDTIDITVQQAPTLELGDNQTLCPSDSILLAAPLDLGNYQWQDGSTTNTFNVTNAGTYALTITNECGVASDAVMITTVEPLELDLGRDTLLCRGEQLVLEARHPDILDYRWQDGSGESFFVIRIPGVYSVQVSNECESIMDEINVLPCGDCAVYVPNIFSPNGDNQNDTFFPSPNCAVEDYLFQVFNRWGTLVFETTNLEEQWNGQQDGQNAPVGVYAWKLTYREQEDRNGRLTMEIGEVNLVR